LLGHVCLAIATFGRPHSVRSDNEAMFTCRLWQRALLFAGIRHRRRDVGCPWQNGRIERFFGTLKAALRRAPVATCAPLQMWLDHFSTATRSPTRCRPVIGSGAGARGPPVYCGSQTSNFGRKADAG
jgi:hypothetical protein